MTASFAEGKRVRLVTAPPYIKTAEPMPMLRPPDVIQLGEEGVILGREPGDYWRVRMDHGAYLLSSQYLELVEEGKGEAILDHDGQA
ncbi:MAG: DUF3148 domain-containing protein [Acaryochloridaceae cyanobacterium SU_2_1]|nr:DUF3148 domain-containing protein [Acaryochloridaceae cyanobacterium SU_2_1]